MNRCQMTIADFKKLQETFKTSKQRTFPYKVGDNIFIRTVTLYYTGRVSKIEGGWVTLETASWIADTGRFYDFLKDGNCSEYESFQDSVSIPMGSIIDVTKWTHNLFTGNK